MKKFLGSLLVVFSLSATTAVLAAFLLFETTLPSSVAFPLHYAAKRGDVAEIERLLNDEECEIDGRDECGQTALHRAAENGHVECLKKLIEGGADIEAATNTGGTPLHYAASSSGFECLKELVALKANIEASNCSGWTPLHAAARRGCLECVQYLVYEAGADVEAKNKEGATPKDVAVENGKQDVVDFFNTLQELPTIKGTEI